MGKVFESITSQLQDFIRKQHLFFVATAPLNGHINLSPKGTNSFHILSENKVAYLDMTGSGNETSAHLMENGRITIMFCAFEGAPNVVRLYGTGYTVLPNHPEWQELSQHFSIHLGVRQIIVADVTRVSAACGHGVPLYEYIEDRDLMAKWAAHKGEAGIREYWQQKNLCSIDDLPTPLGENFDTQKA